MAMGERGPWTQTRFAIQVAAFCILLGTGALVLAQSTNGQISGLVTDSTGAALVDARLTAVNSATGVSYSNTSNGSGVYVLPQLLPGQYDLSVTKDGFGEVKHSGLTVRTGDHLSMNFTLNPGAVQQSITVTSTVPLMSADQASSSTVLDNKTITELPQLNRNTLDLTSVTPAIQGRGPLDTSKLSSLGSNGYLIANNGNSFSVGGGQVNGTSISVDGNQVQDQEYNATNRSIPTPDAIGEFRVESGILTADHGRYSGGVISVNTQSGTNQYHGRLFEYFRNQLFNSNEWADNASGQTRPSFHQNNYGFSVGGPVSIPHLYDGKNRTFFFFGWEGQRFPHGINEKNSVPSVLERQGDFSQSIINYDESGNPIFATLYDPYHGSDVGGNWVRPQYAGAKICSQADISGGTCPGSNASLSTQSTLFAHYIDLWPTPNHAPDANTSSANNYYSTIATSQPVDRFFTRIDENLSNSHRINLSLSRSRALYRVPAPFKYGGGSVTEDHNWSGSAQYNWVVSPTSIVDIHLGFSTAKLFSNGVSGYGTAPDPNIDTTTWGFDPLIVNNPGRTTSQIAPGINLGNYAHVGGSEFDSFINQNVNGSVAFTKVLNRHTLKVGYEQYFYRFREKGGDKTGVAWINPGGGSNQFYNVNDGLSGSPLAELMMGSSNFFQWGNWNITPYGWNQSAYVMDDWKVNDKLTVQLGLRWDHDGGRTPQSFKSSASSPVMYDLNAKNVLTPNAGWDWSQVIAAVPGLASLPQPEWLTKGATGRVALLNTPEYPQKNLFKTDWLTFQPRIGVSYAINNETVLHMGAGIINQGLGGLSTDFFSFYYNSFTFNQVPSLDGKQWVSELGNDHGLGTFPLQPSGSNLGYFPPVKTNQDYGFQTFGAAANLDQGGTTIGLFHSPKEYSWNVSVQRQLGRNWVATAEYTGIRGIHLLMPVWGWSQNNIPLSYYQLGTDLSAQVPDPFFGQSQAFASEPTVSLSQLLGLSPQYSQVSPGQASWGKSLSNFLNLQVQGRAYHGLTLLASYSFRRTLTNTGGKDIQHSGPAGRGLLQNPHNLNEAYGLALYEMPQTLLLNYGYELPFGRGRQFLNSTDTVGGRIRNILVGGWNLAGVSTWNPKGTPVLVPTVGDGVTAPGAALRWSLAPGVGIQTSKDYSKNLIVNGAFVNSGATGVFNPAAFVHTPDFGLSNAPFVFSNIRNPGSFYTDATLLKKFHFSSVESRYAELRIEAQNIFNHANFNELENNPLSPTFGGVKGKSGQRVMQVGARIFF